jgi:hypothetical protein
MDEHTHDLLGGMLIGLVVGGIFMAPILVYRLVKWLQTRDLS